MKAMFKLGGFTQFLDLPEAKPDFYIPFPPGKMQVFDSEFGDVSGQLMKKMEFTLKTIDRLNDVEVAIYEFVGIS